MLRKIETKLNFLCEGRDVIAGSKFKKDLEEKE
jgi:hypothetical protein